MPTRKSKRNAVNVSVERTVDSVIVHDMKNLAFRLSALLQNLEEHYEDPLFKESMTDVLGDTIRKMDAIVKRFKTEKQHVIIKLRVDINQILSELLRSLPSRLTRNIQLQTQFSEIPLVWGDPYYLNNAFHSIVQNAIEAMPDGGVLTLKTELTKRHNKPIVSVEISDSGIGMSESFLKNKLFTPFVSTKEQGLGLGLFTCQQILA
ncbi:MAG TPA: ATP-binding protein, partial [Candidatus Hodarchaeales archaeon]|nr:ATP-binding protein [Candidatus Hodarchaeales archaeon]